jgi:uncharacterized protein YukE
MSKPLQAIPPDMLSASAAFAALSDEAAQAIAATQREWGRLDAGWRSYAKANVDADFDALGVALQRKELMMRAIGAALAESARAVTESDVAAAALFGADALAPQPRGPRRPIIEPPWGSGINPLMPVTGDPALSPVSFEPDDSVVPATPLLPVTGDDLLSGQPATDPANIGNPPPSAGVKFSTKERVVYRVGSAPVTIQGSGTARIGNGPSVIIDPSRGGISVDLGVFGLHNVGTVYVADGEIVYSKPPVTAYTIDMGPNGTVEVHLTPITAGISRPHPDTGAPSKFVGTAISIVWSNPSRQVTGSFTGTIRAYPPVQNPHPTPTPVPVTRTPPVVVVPPRDRRPGDPLNPGGGFLEVPVPSHVSTPLPQMYPKPNS